MSDEILARVVKCVGEVLAAEPEEITAQASLMEDLGADSLDLVELMYLLEQEFAVALGQQDLSLSAQLGIPEAEIHHDEVLTPKALELLRERYPDARGLLVDGIERQHLAALLTVGEVARAMERKLGRNG